MIGEFKYTSNLQPFSFKGSESGPPSFEQTNLSHKMGSGWKYKGFIHSNLLTHCKQTPPSSSWGGLPIDRFLIIYSNIWRCLQRWFPAPDSGHTLRNHDSWLVGLAVNLPGKSPQGVWEHPPRRRRWIPSKWLPRRASGCRDSLLRAISLAGN